MRFFGEWSFRKNLQVLLVILPRFGFVSDFLLTLRQAKTRDRVIVFVIERLFITLQRGLVILAIEIEVADFNIFHRFHRIPGMKLLHIDIFGTITFFDIRDRRLAVRMSLGVVFRRIYVDSSIAAGTLLGFAVAVSALL